MYLSITLCTGELLENFLVLYLHYFPSQEEKLMRYSFLRPYLLSQPGAHPQDLHGEADEECGTKLNAVNTSLSADLLGTSGTLSPDDNEGISPDPRVTSFANRRASRASMTRSQDLSFLLDEHVDMNPSFGGPVEGPSSGSSRRRSSVAPEFNTTFSTSYVGDDSVGFGSGDSGKDNSRNNFNIPGIAANTDGNGYMRI